MAIDGVVVYARDTPGSILNYCENVSIIYIVSLDPMYLTPEDHNACLIDGSAVIKDLLFDQR